MSPGIVIFRSQLSETNEASTTELVSYIEQWIDNSEGLIVDGAFLSFERTCPLVVPSIDSIECPSGPDMQSADLGGIAGGIIGAILLVTILLVAIGVIILISRKLKKQRTRCEGQSSKP